MGSNLSKRRSRNNNKIKEKGREEEKEQNGARDWIRLHALRMMGGLPIDQPNSAAMIDLLTREITPEDYSLLCSLDEKNKRTTVTNIDKIYNRRKEKKKQIEPCPICLEDMNDQVVILTECKHEYHENCVLKWFKEYSTKCPTCAHDYDIIKK